MKIILNSLATITLLAFAQPAHADHGKNFHCSSVPIKSERAKEAVGRLTHNKGMRQILLMYVVQWENEEMHRVCDAAAAGLTPDTSCFDGRRDWDAIQSKIPDGLIGKSNKELRPLMLELQKQGYHTTERAEALKYCANLGVVDRSFK